MCMSSDLQLRLQDLGCLHGEFVFLLSLQDHRETDRFLAASGVQVTETNFHFRRVAFSSQSLKVQLTHHTLKTLAYLPRLYL